MASRAEPFRVRIEQEEDAMNRVVS